MAVRKSGVDDGGGVERSVKKKTQRREKEERSAKKNRENEGKPQLGKRVVLHRFYGETNVVYVFYTEYLGFFFSFFLKNGYYIGFMGQPI